MSVRCARAPEPGGRARPSRPSRPSRPGAWGRTASSSAGRPARSRAAALRRSAGDGWTWWVSVSWPGPPHATGLKLSTSH
ncbi:hypothetical protein ETU37_01290 [Nocardioides iriomotensis]|uniref:Uncharacterized protein n=1 Tax=Nocardioides iriomotensis TaxID=715784 RepID=A0A4Q5JC87_9ACTN|nr:hypothetical protein ETU37_01290 [Nocardioides iriomotensis]